MLARTIDRHVGDGQATEPRHVDGLMLTDGSGRWFDRNAADVFDEETFFDGRGHVSRATGSECVHETLYRTGHGLWVLHHRENLEGGRDTVEELTDERAAAWLLGNEIDPCIAGLET